MKNRRNAGQSTAKAKMDEPTQTLKEIDEEIAKLKERAATIIASEKVGVVDRIKEAIAYYSLTAGDLGFGEPARVGRGGKAKAVQPAAANGSGEGAADPVPVKKIRAGAGGIKFKDDAGNSWSGFGPKPRWFTEALAAGKTVEDLKA